PATHRRTARRIPLRGPSMPDCMHAWLRRAMRLCCIAGLLGAGASVAAAQTPAVTTAQTPPTAAAPTPPAAAAQAPADAAALYERHCASCHGAQRTGGMGPALLPESLERLRPAELPRVIA